MLTIIFLFILRKSVTVALELGLIDLLPKNSNPNSLSHGYDLSSTKASATGNGISFEMSHFSYLAF